MEVVLMENLKRNARLNLVLDPPVKEGITTLAAIHKSSVNGFINEILKKYVEANQEVLSKYDDFIETLSESKTNTAIIGDLFTENK